MNIVGLLFAEPTTNEALEDCSVIPEGVLDAQSASWSEPLGTRMKLITEELLGKPYLLNGIGELEEPDPDPLVRYDAFDCLTFVEEALSLSLGRTPMAVEKIRKDLRYGDGVISYANRNHFMISQWIPNAIDKGYLKDITHTLGETHIVSKTITRRTWERWRGRRHFFFSPDQFPVGTYTMGVLSLDEAFKAIPNIPEGALIVVVRQNNPYNPVWITHLGFVVRHSDTDVRIRHATKMAGGVVKEHYLKWYFEHIRLYLAPMEGILVLMPQEISQATP
jgi:hypothetical protein